MTGWLTTDMVRAMVARARRGDARRFYRELVVTALVSAAADGQEVGEQARLVQELVSTPP